MDIIQVHRCPEPVNFRNDYEKTLIFEKSATNLECEQVNTAGTDESLFSLVPGQHGAQTCVRHKQKATFKHLVCTGLWLLIRAPNPNPISKQNTYITELAFSDR